MNQPVFFMVPTPIGNLDDITLRALTVLRQVDAVAVEDSRRTAKLLAHHEIQVPLLLYHNHNETWAAEEILRRLQRGQKIALVSDGGMPGISDPGYCIVQRLIQEKIPFTVLPGPSAVQPSLLLSGLPSERFLFLGFLPRRGTQRVRVLARIRNAEETVVFYESPRRITRTITELGQLFPGRAAAVVREVSKIHEEVIRFKLGTEPVITERGEMVLILAPRGEDEGNIRDLSVNDQIAEWQRLGLSRREALKAVATERRVAKSEIYRELEKSKANRK